MLTRRPADRSVSRHVFYVFCLLLLSFAAFAAVAQTPAPTPPTTKDRETIRQTIQAQIDAFRADDAQKAFSFASPQIQDKFGSAETFMVMVKTGYRPVYRPKAVFFQEAEWVEGQVLQPVLIVAEDDKQVMAIYPMERQADASWRIAGCFLQPVTQKLQAL